MPGFDWPVWTFGETAETETEGVGKTFARFPNVGGSRFKEETEKTVEASIDAWLAKSRERSLREVPLNACVLIGGASSRMGREKHLIPYAGVPQSTQAFRLLRKALPKTRVGIVGKGRQRQDLDEETKPHFWEDRYPDKGAFGGVMTALEICRHEAMLVVGCDYPLLDEETVRRLVAGRDPLKAATLIRNPSGKLETVFAIYEPIFSPKLLYRFARTGRFGGQDFLASLSSAELEYEEGWREKIKSFDTPRDLRTYPRFDEGKFEGRFF